MSADRNLLFGILALQMDFITCDQLLAAMQAWALAKHRPLGEIFVEQGVLRGDARALLDALVAKHLEAHGGDPQQSLAALGSAGRARRALEGVADDDVQASLRQLGTATAGDSEATGPWAPARDGAGRFRILRPHAKGGLGQVFVALDGELRREVALKEIQEAHADDPDSWTRFLLEAEVTRGLEHPGIVPVYGLGCYPDGRPYYAMRFVRGDSLKDAIEHFHRADVPGT